ncbi:MAG: tRNA epoxyqueuosine(34) reductase QueG, partial [Acidimicrobiaceae bacterium]|nr:tRNA epoxyqueuosine(34) reductase QueG [Acidimicrobiaceae bacterium]
MAAGESADLVGLLREVGTAAGLDAVGVASADPFDDVREVLEERAAEGLAGGMQFTYRNPARSTDPRRTLAGARSLVVGARRYEREEAPHPVSGGPRYEVPARVARSARSDHYAELRSGLGAISEELRVRGWRTVVLADDNALVDRAAAWRAGIGWYGKNTNILIPGAGSWFVLGSVVTDAELAPDRPVEEGCGSCRRCLPACPTGALVAPGVLDARRCLSWLAQAPGVFPVEYRVALGDRLYGCDDCQEVCPVNRLHSRRQPAPPAAADSVAAVDALDLLRSDDATLLARHGRWYLAKREVRWLRRNALLVLGNTADPEEPAVADALR